MSKKYLKVVLVTAPVNLQAMRKLVDHDNHQMRENFTKLLMDPIFQPRYHAQSNSIAVTRAESHKNFV